MFFHLYNLSPICTSHTHVENTQQAHALVVREIQASRRWGISTDITPVIEIINLYFKENELSLQFFFRKRILAQD